MIAAMAEVGTFGWGELRRQSSVLDGGQILRIFEGTETWETLYIASSVGKIASCSGDGEPVVRRRLLASIGAHCHIALMLL